MKAPYEKNTYRVSRDRRINSYTETERGEII